MVNDKLNISKRKLKAFRALLFQIEKDGIQGKTWGDPNVDLLSSIEGFARYVHMVNPEKGKPFISRVSVLVKKYKPKPKRNFFGKLRKAVDKAVDNKSKKPWWKIW